MQLKYKMHCAAAFIKWLPASYNSKNIGPILHVNTCSKTRKRYQYKLYTAYHGTVIIKGKAGICEGNWVVSNYHLSHVCQNAPDRNR